MRRDAFQGLADPIRRDILMAIIQQPLSLNQVAERFPVTRQAISKHIKVLSECGLICVQQQGRERLCEIQAQGLDEIADWLSDFKRQWDERFNRLDQLLEEIQ
jgi:DNA-binding transcriptional ArsR family regulator